MTTANERRTAVAANDKIVLGLIGCGGMGAADMRELMNKPEIEVAALCDVDSDRMTNDIKDVEKKYGKKPGIYRLRCEVPKLRLYMGRYSLTTHLTNRAINKPIESLVGICPFEVSMIWAPRERYDFNPSDCTYIEDCNWSVART